ASEGPLVPPVAEPPLPPVVVVTWVLVAVFSCRHWFAPVVLPVASRLHTAPLLLPPMPFEPESPLLSRPEIAFDWSLSSLDCDWAERQFAVEWQPSDFGCAPSPTAIEGPLVPPVATPPLPAVVVVAWVFVAVLV